MDNQKTIQDLLLALPQTGRIEWIGLRPGRKANIKLQQQAELNTQGILGDHYSGGSGKRAVTLVQFEHLSAIASMLHVDAVAPESLRRNIVVSGINLLALKNRRFILGAAELEMTGYCHPCSRMEQTLGAGAYNAMRGHGGITARVIRSGRIQIGDTLSVIEN